MCASSADYESAVSTLYACLAPRDLLAYLDQRLQTEHLAPEMRVSGEWHDLALVASVATES